MIGEYFLDGLQYIVCQLADCIPGLDVLIQLLEPGCTGDDAAHFLAPQDPGDGQLRWSEPKFSRDHPDPAHFADRFGSDPVFDPGHFRYRSPAAFGNAGVVFSGQNSITQRAEGGKTQCQIP